MWGHLGSRHEECGLLMILAIIISLMVEAKETVRASLCLCMLPLWYAVPWT